MAIAVIVGITVLVCAGLWWASRLPPTRPRPKSRYRGDTFTTIDRELRDKRRD